MWRPAARGRSRSPPARRVRSHSAPPSPRCPRPPLRSPTTSTASTTPLRPGGGSYLTLKGIRQCSRAALMGRHHRASGRHRAPSQTGRSAARFTTAGFVAAVPLAAATPAYAEGMPQNVRAAIIACESGGRNIENGGDAGGVSTASGIFQFTDGTWRTFGGREFASRAIGATEAEQTIVADRAFEANGLRDWEASRACWQPRVGEAKHAADTLRHGRSPPQHSAESYTVKRG